MPSELREKLRAVVAPHTYLLENTRAKRFKSNPFQAVYFALVRRWSYLVMYRLKLVSPVSSALTFWGDKLKSYFPGNFSLKRWGYLDGEEVLLTDYLLANLKEGDVFIDGGAHIGYYSLLASRLVGATGQVHAFEPTPFIYALTKENVSQKSNVVLNPLALWNKEGEVEFSDFGPEADLTNAIKESSMWSEEFVETYGKQSKMLKVKATTIDAYCEAKNVKPTYIKLDVEGAEFAALEGARATLSHHPVIVVEIIRRALTNGAYDSIEQYLAGYGYKPFIIHGNFSVVPYDAKEGKEDFDLTNIIFKAASVA